MPYKSLSIVHGIPIIGKLFSLKKTLAPVRDPSPPNTISPSILFFLSIECALSLPAFVLNSSDLAVFNIVPPTCIVLPTSALDKILILFSISPC